MKYFSKSYLQEKWSHAGFQKYFRNTAWMLGSRIFSMGISFLTTLYIARTLGPTNFGELDYAFAVIGIFAPLASFGIINVLQRELIKYPEHKNELTGTAFALNFGFALLATVCVLLFTLLTHIDPLSRILVVILSGTYTLSTFQLLQQDFYARAESKIPSLITMGVWATVSFSKVVVLVLGKGVIWLAIISVLEQVMYAVAFLFAYYYSSHSSIISWKVSSRFVPIFLKTGAASALVGFFSLIYARIDQIFIRHMIDAHAVGLYSAGVRLVEIWNILPALLLSGLYPALVNARNTSEALYRRRMRRIMLVLIISSLILALGTSLASPFLIKHIFGTEFMGGTEALRIYAWSIIGTFLGQYVMNILFTDDYRKILIATNILPAVVNILLNIWLIPFAGIAGAAYATVIAYSLTPLVPFIFPSTRKRILETL